MSPIQFAKQFAFSAGVLTQLFVFQVSADPVAKTKVVIERTSASALQLTDKLSMNVMRTQSVQVPYDVEVPYQDTEEYEVEVPYTTSVAYTDTETYYTTEYQCENRTEYENECHYERVCHDTTTYENVCQNVQECHDVTDYQNVCRNEQECRDVPNAPVCHIEQVCRTGSDGKQVCFDKNVCTSGGERRECSNRQVCTSEPVRRQQCGTHQVCRNEPRTRQDCNNENVCNQVPRTRQHCENVQVPHTRNVTKYRDETRYRSETRTRTVTRYRTESRCCNTEQQQVFDHQFNLAVVLNFAADSVLLADESESVQVVLSGSESNPQVQVKVENAVFKYQVLNQQISGGKFTADVRRLPAFTAQELGLSTIKDVHFKEVTTGQWGLAFKDLGQRARVETKYSVSLADVAAPQIVLWSAPVMPIGSKDILVPVGFVLDIQKEYLVKIEVSRQGLNLDQAVKFESETRLLPLNLVELSDVSKVTDLALGGRDVTTEVSFKDVSRVVAGITTLYKVNIYRKSTSARDGFKLLVSKSMDRSKLTIAADQTIRIRLKDLGASDKNLTDYARSKRELKVEIVVTRQDQTGSRLPQTIQFTQAKVVKVP